jgi:hypothetical protein
MSSGDVFELAVQLSMLSTIDVEITRDVSGQAIIVRDVAATVDIAQDMMVEVEL